MNSEFSISLGAAHKLELAGRRNDWETEDVEWLSTAENGRIVALLRTGKAKLVEVTEMGGEGVIISTAPTPTSWAADDQGNIHFRVTSNGMAAEQWADHFKGRGPGSDVLGPWLRRVNEAPTNGLPYHVIVRPGGRIAIGARVTRGIYAHGVKKGWVKPHWEVACLICNMFSSEEIREMGFSQGILVMHEPIKDSYDSSRLLSVAAHHNWLELCSTSPGRRWSVNYGFAFVVPEVGSQT